MDEFAEMRYFARIIVLKKQMLKIFLFLSQVN